MSVIHELVKLSHFDLSLSSRSDVLQEGLELLVFSLAPQILELIGSVLFVANQFGMPLLYIILITSTSLFIVNQATRKTARAQSTAFYDRMDHRWELQTESVSTIELLKYFCMEPYEINRYGKASYQMYKALWTKQVYSNARDLTLDLIRLSGK